MQRLSIFTVFMVLFSVSIAIAQEACPALVETTMRTVAELCASTGRNQVCYGHSLLEAVPQENISEFTFEDEGDVTDVAAISNLQLSGLDAENNIWGVALMRLQANIPDTLPGQNVTMLIFGDSQIRNEVPMGQNRSQFNPMQAFFFRTGISNPACEQVPDNGLIVQTPQGVRQINFRMNQIDVAMGSTVYFTIGDENRMSISTIEGAVRVRTNEAKETAIAGTRIWVPLDEETFEADGGPTDPESYADDSDIFALPLEPLEREIEVPVGLNDEELAMLEEFDDVFNNIRLGDTNDLFAYLETEEDPDVAGFLITELGYTGFTDDLEAYFEGLGIELESYEGYTGEAAFFDDFDFDEFEEDFEFDEFDEEFEENLQDYGDTDFDESEFDEFDEEFEENLQDYGDTDFVEPDYGDDYGSDDYGN